MTDTATSVAVAKFHAECSVTDCRACGAPLNPYEWLVDPVCQLCYGVENPQTKD